MGCLIIEKRPRVGISGKMGVFPWYTDVQPKEPVCTLYPACIDEIDNNKSLNHDKDLGNIEILFKKVE